MKSTGLNSLRIVQIWITYFLQHFFWTNKSQIITTYTLSKYDRKKQSFTSTGWFPSSNHPMNNTTQFYHTDSEEALFGIFFITCNQPTLAKLVPLSGTGERAKRANSQLLDSTGTGRLWSISLAVWAIDEYTRGTGDLAGAASINPPHLRCGWWQRASSGNNATSPQSSSLPYSIVAHTENR